MVNITMKKENRYEKSNNNYFIYHYFGVACAIWLRYPKFIFGQENYNAFYLARLRFTNRIVFDLIV